MSEVQTKAAGAKPRRDWITYALWGLSLVGVAAVLYVIVGALGKPKTEAATDLKSLAHGEMAKLVVASDGKPAPDAAFVDGQGRAVHVSDFKAPVVIVNLWATWCAPCRQEMPALAKLQAAYPGKVIIVPVAEDKAEDKAKAQDFIGQYAPLPFYQDPKLGMSFALNPPAEGLPTTVIYDKTGRERARLSGGADWNSPDARAIVEALLKGG
ncbi:TlpA family protein disulfide reductase [Phenylobacterium montanum]|uniref:TlpA family protein disulfide reductase n=1 Tax=Phenylobacterium montanum TaxID=2823693 RepID=A0A975ITM4_9CAUL|nr:TlpA disulfide reductase family protein [Caulobacter sp. S6]QUD86928.1 TlpA family protein disulfide reductase [Caulobacter sp. S6]